jgi:TPR repeat protein
VRPDPARVAGLYRDACGPGREASACTSLAALIEQGKLAAATPGEAARLRQSACTLDKTQCQPGAALAAAKPATAPAAAPKAAPAPAPAAKPAEKPDPLDVCNKSTDKVAAAEACELLGTVFGMNISDGEGADHEASGRFFHRACSLERGSACRNLGTKFSFGEIGQVGNPPVPNHKLAVVYFRKACDLDPIECTWLGSSYELGEGVAKDLAEAFRLHSKSCAAKDGYGCNNAAEVLEKLGSGTPVQILQLYTQGCDLEDVRACFQASRRHERGIGTKVDKAKAAVLRTKACGLDFFKSLEEGFCPKEPAKAPAKPKS